MNFLVAHIPPYGWATTPARFAVAAGVTTAFAMLARVLRGVNSNGALAGGIACFLLFASAGPAAFIALATLFVMTWAATRRGYRRKLALGLAEPKEGRNVSQVLGNLSVAALASVVFSVTGNRAWLLAVVAALAEAATDTVASEIGQYRRSEAWLITTWERVAAGTDGGMTIGGSIAGLGAGVIVVAMATMGGLVSQSSAWIPVVAGFAGMIIDSIFGATLQRRGWISNQTVNLLGTLAGAVLAFLLFVTVRR